MAIDDLGPSFDLTTIKAAATSSDPRERNKVAVIERETDLLINWLDELAQRGLAEARRTGKAPVGGSGWEGLAELGVISDSLAERLRDAKEIRNELAHAYPPQSWRSLIEAVAIVQSEIDGYKLKVDEWLRSIGVLS